MESKLQEIDKAELFNKFFSSMYTTEDLNHVPDEPEVKEGHSVLSNITFTVSDIMELLLNLNSNKSPGPDTIHPRVLKECAEVLALPLYLLFTASMEHGKLPAAWKEAVITPIFKKGARTAVNNY